MPWLPMTYSEAAARYDNAEPLEYWSPGNDDDEKDDEERDCRGCGGRLDVSYGNLCLECIREKSGGDS